MEYFFFTYVEISAFFRDLYTRTVTEEDILNLEINIHVILATLRRYFPIIFDVMEHLSIYLARELELEELEDLVQYR